MILIVKTILAINIKYEITEEGRDNNHILFKNSKGVKKIKTNAVNRLLTTLNII